MKEELKEALKRKFEHYGYTDAAIEFAVDEALQKAKNQQPKQLSVSDEEIREKISDLPTYDDVSISYCNGFFSGAKWMREKLNK